MKKLLLLSLMAALPMVALSATTQVTAQLRVVDPTSEVYLNLSSTSAAFGNVLIAPGDVDLTNPISIILGGTNTANAYVSVPSALQLTSGTNHISATAKLSTTDTGATVYNHGGYVFLASNDSLDTDTDHYVSGSLSVSLNLEGTEQPGRYSGIIPVYAAYN